MYAIFMHVFGVRKLISCSFTELKIYLSKSTRNMLINKIVIILDDLGPFIGQLTALDGFESMKSSSLGMKSKKLMCTHDNLLA